ncbi:CubicO group peptidase, beta-lactamase class C family [Arsukibacterium tuosuense]|uniref:CubicO group peptidase, beta-lactamase class C family n=1 Tax=Arsukibacterium tuosuense TaxID=1323745 RepID=A0A285ICN2_9GAMM|nr:penicillin binding protein PBP4B [Arsukibacterium tuosuense]SNY45754.1 CubicO group peptidase, beta-lactamase class C family [Arsukibacterium tuosuense]
MRLIIMLLLLVLSGCAMAPDGINHPLAQPLTGAEQLALAEQAGQHFVHWPEQRSSRKGVNNRRLFSSWQGQGMLLVDLKHTETATIAINGQRLRLTRPEHGQPFKIDISPYTRSGGNHLQLISLQPATAQLTIAVPYPELNNQPVATAANSQRFSKIDQLITEEVAAGFPGAVLLIVKDGQIIKETAYGYALRYQADGTASPEPEPLKTTTLFDIASNTKMYATTYAVMQLVSSGMLDINRPLTDYLPEYLGDGREQRLVSDLLNHTSGYAPEVHFHRPDNRNGPLFYSLNKAYTDQLLLGQVPFSSDRAKTARYSDVNFMLLGLLIERLTTMPLDRYLEQQFYRPLGLNNVLFNPLQKGVGPVRIAATELDGNSRGGRVNFPANRQGVLRGQVHDEKAFHALQGVAGHAGLFASARDLAVLMSVVAQQGGYGWQRFFSPAVVQQFTRPSGYDHRFGLGWRTAAGGDLSWHFGAYASDYAYGHTGWTGTATLIDPAHNLMVVLLTNKKHSPITDSGTSYEFAGDSFETGRYGTIMTLIYEALLQ